MGDEAAEMASALAAAATLALDEPNGGAVEPPDAANSSKLSVPEKALSLHPGPS